MDLKELRYNIMLALYFPILLYAFSTFDISENTYAIEDLQPVVVGEETVVLGQPFEARAFLAVGTGQGQQLLGDSTLVAQGDSLFLMPTALLLADDENEKEITYAGRFQLGHAFGLDCRLTALASARPWETLSPECG